ncbi:MAG: type II toxin-antitoxin system RelE/ParE family toxin [Bacteroidetes bacterium]|nr:type II toxin-antitoxin system RelE/ParE family toxin [Bacteroidota bacterium]MBU1116335.1 type II toxin-antitoxin system RelE/ParE family toxin [Bacteroidota bacterium]MBU1796908.1 type II toxin-antitoxin system RelE/ParE family toxin [Bacteroidota bacterium]
MEKYKVFIDTQAKQDLKEIFIYMAINDGSSLANKLLETLEEACYKLEEFPERGHIPQELKQTGINKYLEIHSNPYRIIYEIEKNIIYIHCVLDGRRDIQEILNERMLR